MNTDEDRFETETQKSREGASSTRANDADCGDTPDWQEAAARAHAAYERQERQRQTGELRNSLPAHEAKVLGALINGLDAQLVIELEP